MSEEKQKENVIYQMQHMFAALHEVDRQYYDPISFVQANKADPLVQMDVDEFFNTTCDKVSPSPFTTLII
jgi:hypothetical protein